MCHSLKSGTVMHARDSANNPEAGSDWTRSLALAGVNCSSLNLGNKLAIVLREDTDQEPNHFAKP